MNILIDIGHPAHVHNYKNFAKQMCAKGHRIFWTIRDNPIIKSLLTYYKFDFEVLKGASESLFSKFITHIYYDAQIYQFTKINKIDIALGFSVPVTHVSSILPYKSIIFDDDDDTIQLLTRLFVYPFADTLVRPIPLKGTSRSKKNVFYNGTHELAYLHPNRFTPDSNVLLKLGLTEGTPYFVLRFVSLKAHHDKGHIGINLHQKREIVKLLENKGKILISSEIPIEPEFEKYRVNIPYNDIHSLLYFAKLLIGDSQTMISEAAILGTPALKCNSFAGKLSVPNELENKYGLCYSFHPNDFECFLSKVKDLLEMHNLKESWRNKRKVFLQDKIDVTAFMVWFIENYPESTKVLMENPDIQNKFK